MVLGYKKHIKTAVRKANTELELKNSNYGV
jgi:hypothetical protein